MKWGSPDLLPWLWLLIPAAWFIFHRLRRRERLLGRLVAAEVVPVLAPLRNARRTRNRNLLWLGAVGLALLALARPQWGTHWEEVRRRGLDALVVLDTSRSMLAEDIKPNRMQQAKWGIRDLVGKLKGDRVGLVAFAGSSFLQCPLTIDYAAFLMTLDDVRVGTIPRGGTAIAQALKAALNGFEQSTQADRVIVLITDGDDHEGKPLDLVDDLKKAGIRVYAVGVGSVEGELIPAMDEQNRQGFFKDREGKVVKTALNEGVLQQLALATGGMYVRSAAGDFGLERIYDEGIQQLRRDEQESRMVRMHEDRHTLFLGAALLLLLIEALLAEAWKGNGRVAA